ncbi:HesA/MoeB/ThiF family protein [Deinococcus antarcticus]|uniref:HesA/MoeB/ThiF family protein n=1 Tax=Deinococcus antarcticus TaxID=1298767 RepID=A0ABV8AAG9_9DEIO
MTESQHDQLMVAVGEDWSVETAAFLIAYAVPTPGGAYRLITKDIVVPPQDAYEQRTANRLTLSAAYMAQIYQQTRQFRCSVIQAHSHPDGSLEPSTIDLMNEAQTLPRLRYHAPGQPHGRIIITPNALHARLFLQDGQDKDLHVQSVGRSLHQLSFLTPLQDEIYDRQIRAFGSSGQVQLQNLRVAVVGSGGTGSLAAQQLAHLGIRHLRFYDDDLLEDTNLNRVVGATPDDVGRPKVDISAELMQRIQPGIAAEPRQADVTIQHVARSLLDVDIVLACTDSQGSRAVLNQLAYQYLLPVIDVGINIHVLPSKAVHISGRIQMLSPSLPCLLCTDSLDLTRVRTDLMTAETRQADPYVRGEDVKEPAVISLNSTAVGVAISMFLSAVTGFPIPSRYTLLNLHQSQMRTPEMLAKPGCPHCSAQGAYGLADTWTAPGRPR